MKTVRSNTITKIAAASAITLGVLSAAHAVGLSDNASMNAKLRLLSPLTITAVTDLDFGDALEGVVNNVVVATGDAGAASITATGFPNAAVVASLQDASITMTTGAGTTSPEQITVDTFTLGGSVSGAGVGAFDGSGDISGILVGGTAHILAEDVAGNYTGSNTFVLTYQ